MQQQSKVFSEALQKSLDELNAPPNIRERAAILSKMFHIPKQDAWGMLEGQIVPDDEILERMRNELEIDVTPFLKK